MAVVAHQRKRALSARRGLDPNFRQWASRRACQRLARLPVIRRARRIGIYWPLASEIDPRPLIAFLKTSSPRFYYPHTTNHLIRFIPVGETTRWSYSVLGTREPGGQSRPVTALDVLIMPLAGFDTMANRIGLGGGFYDRTLAAVRHAPYRSPRRIGLAFECQRIEAITPRPWDVELAAVVTETAIHWRHHGPNTR